MSKLKRGDRVWFEGMDGRVGATIKTISGGYSRIKVDKEYLKGNPHEYKGGSVRTELLIPRDEPKKHNFF